MLLWFYGDDARVQDDRVPQMASIGRIFRSTVMETSQNEWGERGAVTENSAHETDPEDANPEDVAATLLGVAGFLGLLVLLAVLGALGATMALLRHWGPTA
jgi:hypothetical protein